LDLHHLRYFVAVAERLHFAEAAEFVHVSQPGLSQKIKALEEELGVLLLDRTKRKVTLTEAGKYFLEEAKLTLEHAERAMAVARKVSRGKLGTVRIGHVHSIPFSGLLTKLTSAFHRYAPGIHLEFVEGDAIDLLASIMERDLDLGFIRLPHEDVPSEIAIQTVLVTPSVDQLVKARAPGWRVEPICVVSPIGPRSLLSLELHSLSSRVAQNLCVVSSTVSCWVSQVHSWTKN